MGVYFIGLTGIIHNSRHSSKLNMKEIKKITVLGTGNMGPGIALVFAKAGFKVSLWGPEEKDTETGEKNLNRNIDDLINNSIIKENDKAYVLDNVILTTSLGEAAGDNDLIIEAVPEDIGIKKSLFNKLEELCRIDTIIASNTSTLLPSQLNKDMKYPERFLVAHYWNPAYLAPLVEVCVSNETSPEVISATMDIIKKTGNEPVLIRKEILGFIGNRIMHAMNREALALIGEGVCDPEDIDKVVLSSFGPRFANLGPMEYLDFSGLDLIRNIQGYLYGNLDNTPGVLPVIEKLNQEGNLGIKTGKGLFDWSVKENRIRENRDKEFYRRLKDRSQK